ncbi:MAG: hypothetical protein ACQESN_10560 [Thermotogota bacterium]
MKNKIIILIILTTIISGFSFFDFGYNRFNFDNEGFSYDLNVGISDKIDYYALFENTFTYRSLYLNSYEEMYTANATSLFEENIQSKIDRKLSLNYFFEIGLLGDKFRQNQYAGISFHLKNQGVFQKYTEFQGLNHELEVSSFFSKNFQDPFKSKYIKNQTSLKQGIGYDFTDTWTYTKINMDLDFNNEIKGFYVQPHINFETVLLESNPEKEYYLPKINLKNSQYNLAVSNYLKNDIAIGYAFDSEYYLPMKTRIGLFGETIYYSEEIKNLFKEGLDGFAGINLTHTITEQSIGSWFEFEAGIGKHFTKNSISDNITPYFRVEYNWQFSVAVILGLLGPIIVK